ncbi:MAG: hypothetical protein K8R48_04620 [Alphaproteobacteria bacterium]|nr:hypothetical protein [Alphaproteobacteria bacterium]
MAFGKKTIKEKFGAAARKVLLWAGLAGVVGGPVAYEYGTIETQTVKVESYQGDDENGYTLKTDKGTFNIERSRLHLQSKEDVHAIYWPINSGRTYDIKTYGWHLIGNWQPNILDAHEVTQEELDKRAADLKKGQDKPNTNTTPSNNNNNSSTQPALSGQMVTTNVIINGYNVQITIPIEAAGKVTINSVAPVVQTNNVTVTPPVNTTPPANNSNPPTP